MIQTNSYFLVHYEHIVQLLWILQLYYSSKNFEYQFSHLFHSEAFYFLYATHQLGFYMNVLPLVQHLFHWTVEKCSAVILLAVLNTELFVLPTNTLTLLHFWIKDGNNKGL